MALGDNEGKVELPQFDYFRPMSFGSAKFGPEQKEKLAQERGHDPDRVEYVPLTTLDIFEFPRVDPDAHLIGRTIDRLGKQRVNIFNPT